MASVEYRNVSKNFDQVKVLHDINLTINDGEFVVLVGPSGCGKSTSLRMLAGLESVSSGTILIDGKDITDKHPKDRDIAMVFQNYALYPHMSVYENLAFGLKMRRMDKADIDKRVQEAAAILKIEMLLDRKPKALSGGQRQRVALGRAIVRKPKVFLFDEPLSNLDAKLRVQMRSEIKKLHQTLGVTMLYVTHDQVEAMTMGDRICLMDSGYIQQYDTPLNIYNEPTNRFVAGFIGSPPMNFLSVQRKNGGLLLGKNAQPFTGYDIPKNMEKAEIGIRPEDLLIAKEGASATVELIEPLGSELYIELNLAGESVTGRFAPDLKLQPGDKINIQFREQKVHCFDLESGLRCPN
ncbi:MAG TPA: sn-glycerol-3-phosphate ABC transporter ATP-binding protein UgpC [Candidatus Marinimicrobia bacterium]|nr:sn-glycerol-3-phosphate ABC transporter ATP-binding protein UgpC [Candidatus Neomarinimicrobiota bacterium]